MRDYLEQLIYEEFFQFVQKAPFLIINPEQVGDIKSDLFEKDKEFFTEHIYQLANDNEKLQQKFIEVNENIDKLRAEQERTIDEIVKGQIETVKSYKQKMEDKSTQTNQDEEWRNRRMNLLNMLSIKPHSFEMPIVEHRRPDETQSQITVIPDNPTSPVPQSTVQHNNCVKCKVCGKECCHNCTLTTMQWCGRFASIWSLIPGFNDPCSKCGHGYQSHYWNRPKVNNKD